MAVPSSDPEAEERRRRAEEEARMAEMRAHGHAVTPEAFAEWKVKFEAEQALERAKLEDGKAEEKKNRLTGKQWFLQQEAAHLEVRRPSMVGAPRARAAELGAGQLDSWLQWGGKGRGARWGQGGRWGRVPGCQGSWAVGGGRGIGEGGADVGALRGRARLHCSIVERQWQSCLGAGSCRLGLREASLWVLAADFAVKGRMCRVALHTCRKFQMAVVVLPAQQAAVGAAAEEQ